MDISDQEKPTLAILNLEKVTVFTRVSTPDAPLILGSKTRTLIRQRRSFEGGAH